MITVVMLLLIFQVLALIYVTWLGVEANKYVHSRIDLLRAYVETFVPKSEEDDNA